ncbi:MAG TPA: class I SAM-dependent methyltransferase [Pyrinomonadaceae bacterium]|nr:class I SAM-dependent methyltransferase [Pyrinomonadaceae bacterium]
MTDNRSEQLRVEFNEWAKAGRGESMERGHRPVGEQAIAKLNVQSDARVLDVGCGSGWASRIFAQQADQGYVTGIDISDEMVHVASESSSAFGNLNFQVASAESLPFDDDQFSDAFSMESLYYYADMAQALSEIHRVLKPSGKFVNVVDLYQENEPSHQWIAQLAVPVQLLSTEQYLTLFAQAGFEDCTAERLIDPTPVPDDYTGGSFKSREDLLKYRAEGSLMITGRAKK